MMKKKKNNNFVSHYNPRGFLNVKHNNNIIIKVKLHMYTNNILYNIKVMRGEKKK